MKKFATLDQIRDKENDEKKTEYYAGGTDGHGGGSGLNVIDPATSNDPMQKIINNAMKDSNEMSGQNPPEGMRKITLYRNGFTVDDGPLRDLESPENRQFIDALSQGYIPKELQSGSKEVHIGLDDRRGEDYRAPTPPPYVAYSGDAMTLGGSLVSDQAYIFATSTNPIPVVDNSKPTTVLQIKLQNGKKLKLKLNHTHTVLDLATLIDQSDPFQSPYTLSAGFPPRDIVDAHLSLVDAGLLGAAVTQKYL